MSNDTRKLVMEELAGCLDIPESAYDKAEARYTDLGDWFGRPDAHCYEFDPHISPQGSFRLGTVIVAEEYDLDFGCRLRAGITKATHTQEQLKRLVGRDLEEYRRARGIEQRLEEKNRCWRLNYKDELAFHMDGVPSIPEEEQQRVLIEAAMVTYGSDRALAQSVAQLAGSITDIRLPNYKQVSPAWRVSNSEGYAKWFESRMKLASLLMEERALAAKAATVDDLPARRWKSPLQRAVQVLKCHRDRMFVDDPAGKPISIILTTLAAGAYRGELDVADALDGILGRMGDGVRAEKPRVPNPVNPAEDFADKWYDPQYKHLALEANFRAWLRQAKHDFATIGQSRDPNFIAGQAMSKFGVSLDSHALRRKLGGIGAPAVMVTPKVHVITATPAKPWTRR
ncbi:MAG TPA: nucleotidyltransferase [Tepidisphaeraceae bacterium]|nr:nucleotidyltransferase [Tepidisphaeraceae bacterium]